MLPTAGSSETVSDVTASKYLSKSPEYPPTSWKAVRARLSGDPAPAPGLETRGVSAPRLIALRALCPAPLAELRTVTHEDEGPPKNDEGLHGVRVHERCQPSCNGPGSVEIFVRI